MLLLMKIEGAPKFVLEKIARCSRDFDTQKSYLHNSVEVSNVFPDLYFIHNNLRNRLDSTKVSKFFFCYRILK